MPAVDVNSFLNSLAIFMVAAAAAQSPAVSLNYLTTPRGLWINKIVWPDATNPSQTAPADPVSVLRIYGGARNFNDEQRRLSLQCMTTSVAGDSAALAQANALYESLLNPNSGDGPLRPVRNLTIPNYLYPSNQTQSGHWLIVAFEPLGAPGLIGREPGTGRPLIPFNFDVGILPVA